MSFERLLLPAANGAAHCRSFIHSLSITLSLSLQQQQQQQQQQDSHQKSGSPRTLTYYSEYYTRSIFGRGQARASGLRAPLCHAIMWMTVSRLSKRGKNIIRKSFGCSSDRALSPRTHYRVAHARTHARSNDDCARKIIDQAAPTVVAENKRNR